MVLSEEEHQKRLALYEQGMNDPSIAKVLNVKKKVIWRWRYRNGLPANARCMRNGLSNDEREKIMLLYNKDMSDPEIAQLLGLCRRTIFTFRRSRNLPPNKKSFGHDAGPNKMCVIVKQAELMAEVKGDDESLFKDKKFLEKMGLGCDDDA